MNLRERYLETVLFGKPDRVPLAPGGPRESTRERWYTEGLERGRDYGDALREVLGLDEKPDGCATSPRVSFRMMPEFEEKVIEERPNSRVVQDWKGEVVEIGKEFDVSYLREAKDFCTRRWIKEPVETRADWEDMKSRFRADAPERYPADWEAEAKRLAESGRAVRVSVSGPFWQVREWLGAEGICLTMATDPEFVREMMRFWADFVSEVLERVTKQLRIDAFAVSEDMAYKAHSFISPEMTREFLLPIWRQWIDHLRASGTQVFDIDSDGWIGDLIPVWLDAGWNACNPIEVAAGCDVVAFREQFGATMAYRGGIDKRLIAKGGDALKTEIDRILPPMLREGGYIPSCDHGVPPDISWPNFVEYTKQLARHLGWL